MGTGTERTGTGRCQYHHFSLVRSFFLMAIATAEVPTPKRRAISAKESPISLLRRWAILALTSDTLLLRPPRKPKSLSRSILDIIEQRPFVPVEQPLPVRRLG